MRPTPRLIETADRFLLIALVIAALVLAGLSWLNDHPQHNPRAPLDLTDPRGWATADKLAALRNDPEECRAVLERSGVTFTSLPETGEGACHRPDRLTMSEAPLAPATPQMSCAMAAALVLWLEQDLQPMAQENLGSEIARINHVGTYACRRMYGAAQGRWSEHATGNAIDITGFTLGNGQQISVLHDWSGEGPEAEFLHATRDAACASFGTVLSPDYNAAHHDHFHLDQGRSPRRSFCR